MNDGKKGEEEEEEEGARLLPSLPPHLPPESFYLLKIKKESTPFPIKCFPPPPPTKFPISLITDLERKKRGTRR